MRLFCAKLATILGFCGILFFFQATKVSAVTTTVGPTDPISWHLSQLKPGDTLLLSDGIYTNSLFVQISGTVSQPITIKAVNDGKVIFDGQGNHEPVRIIGKYLSIEGIVARNSSGSVFIVSATNTVTLKRVSAYNAKVNANHHVFLVENSNSIVIEDCVGGGSGRYIFLSYASSNVTWRRCFGRWHLNTQTESAPRVVFGIYGSENITLENVIGTHAIPASPGNVQYAGVYITRNDQSGQYDPKNVTVRGSIFYNNWLLGLIGNVSQATNLRVENSVFMDHQGKPCNSAYPEVCRDLADGMSLYLSPNGSVTNTTFANNLFAINMPTTSNTLKNVNFIDNGQVLRGGTGAHSFVNIWGASQKNGFFVPNSTTKNVDPGYNMATYGKGAYLFIPSTSPLKRAGEGGADIGANVIYQTINGTQTTTPLWPWPMEDRIKAEFSRELGLTVSATWETGGGFWKTLAGVYTGVLPTNVPSPLPTIRPTATPTIRPTSSPTTRPSPTVTPPLVCSGDFNNDRQVDLSDYALFIRDFLKPSSLARNTDMNKDGQVDLSDYSVFIKRFLKTCSG